LEGSSHKEARSGGTAKKQTFILQKRIIFLIGASGKPEAQLCEKRSLQF